MNHYTTDHRVSVPANHPRYSSNLQLVLILLLAAILRFDRVRQPYIDAFSWRQSSTAMIAENYFQKDWNIFLPEVNWTGPGPGYQGREFQTVSYLSALLYTVVGQHDWVGRTVAIAFSLWGIFALYKLTRLVWDDEHALVTVLVAAVMPGAIFIERSFLPDPAMVSLIITCLWLWLRFLQTPDWHTLLLTGIFGAWGASTKLPGLIIGLPMAYAWFTLTGSSKRWEPRKLAVLLLLATLILAPTVAYYLWARHLALSYPPYHFAGSGNWLWDSSLLQWASDDYYLPELWDHFTIWLWRWPLIALVFIGFLLRPSRSAASAKRSDNSTFKTPWLFHLWIIGGIIYYVMGARELVDNPWNFHIVDPAAAALAAHAILSISRRIKASVKVSELAPIVVISLIIWFVGRAGLTWMYLPYANDDRLLGLALKQESQPADLVVTLNSALGDPTAIYYSQRRGWTFPPPDPAKAWNRLPSDEEATLLFESLRVQGADWLGLVSSQREDLSQNHPLVMEYIEENSTPWIEGERYTVYRLR